MRRAFKGESGTPLQCLQPGVKGGASEAVFENVRPGVYAIAVFHDANKNNKMDTTFLAYRKKAMALPAISCHLPARPGLMKINLPWAIKQPPRYASAFAISKHRCFKRERLYCFTNFIE
jgi:hypothetical protein